MFLRAWPDSAVTQLRTLVSAGGPAIMVAHQDVQDVLLAYGVFALEGEDVVVDAGGQSDGLGKRAYAWTALSGGGQFVAAAYRGECGEPRAAVVVDAYGDVVVEA